MYMCICKGIKESDIREAGREGAVTAEDLIERLELLDEECCGICLLRMDEFEAIAAEEYAGRRRGLAEQKVG